VRNGDNANANQLLAARINSDRSARRSRGFSVRCRYVAVVMPGIDAEADAVVLAAGARLRRARTVYAATAMRSRITAITPKT
jgi:hypothetical protein